MTTISRLLLALLLVVGLWVAPVEADLGVKVGTFKLGTGSIGANVSVSGFGFTPKYVLLFWNGTTATTDTAAGGHMRGPGIGFVASSSDFRMMTVASQDNVATTSTGGGVLATECVTVMTGANADDGGASCTLDSDGFTVTITDQLGSDYTIGYVAVGGSDVTNVKTGGQNTGTTDPFSVTGVGFQPDTVIFASSGDRTAAAIGSEAALCIGAAAGPNGSIVNAVTCLGSDNAEADPNPPNTKRYGRTGANESLVTMNRLGTFQARCGVSAWQSDGFDIDCTANPAASRWFNWIAIKGGKYKIVDSLTRTDSNDIVTTSFGFTPRLAMVFSHATSQSSAGTAQDHAEMSIGASTAADTGVAFCALDEDKSSDANTETALGYRATDVYCNLSTSDALEGAMKTKSFDSDGITYQMTDTDPAQSFFWTWNVGEIVGGGGGGSGRRSMRGFGK
jgi:hypothetical protein